MSEMKTMIASKSKKYLTPKEAAAILNVSTESIRNWTKAGKLRAVTTLGGHRRFLVEEINRFSASILGKPSEKTQPRVLVVDDDTQFVKALEEYFSTCLDNVAFEKAYDGFEAGHKVNIFNPTIIFLDFLMPNLNGVEVCRYLKNTISTQHIRIVAMTGLSSETVANDFKVAGAETLLAKPFDFGLLDDLVYKKGSVSAGTY